MYKLGPLIGKGNTADVYSVGNGKVVKLFYPRYPHSTARKEFLNSKMLNDLEIPVVKSHELIKIGNRSGIILDQVSGESLLDYLLRTYDTELSASILAQLHKQILSQTLQAASNCKHILESNIQRTHHLTDPSKLKLKAILATLPEGDHLCHGDFHFGNIIMDGQKYHIIDFMNVCSGHKHFDIARTVYLLKMTPVPPAMPKKEAALKLKEEVTSLYLQEVGVNRACLTDWLLVIAAARLTELSAEQVTEINTITNFLAAHGIG